MPVREGVVYMIEQDTICLLRECDSGIKMGVASIEEVLPRVSGKELRQDLRACRQAHDALQREIQQQLTRFHDQGKNPNPLIKGMSRVKTELKLGVEESDAVIAGLMTDGCNMGVKSLNKYLNQYEAADEFSKDITKRLIHLEEQLAEQMRPYL